MKLSKQPLARKDWISACEFHDLTQAQVLDEVAKRVQATPGRPLVLFDLDSTLYEVGPRTFQILSEWSETSEGEFFHNALPLLKTLEERHIGYSVRDAFLALGMRADDPKMHDALEAAKKFWEKRFFTSAYLKYDRAYPGAAEFVRKVYDLGAEVVYLTGRDEPNMGDGTREALLRDGFVWGVPRTHLLLKKASHLPDLEHKVEAGEYVRRHGTLVASFENEPKNLVALYEVFPDAMHVFVDTIYSDHEAIPCRGLYRIAGF
jgi:hypothetical protein